MTLNLKMLATLDATGVESGAREAKAALTGIGRTAETASSGMGQLGTAAAAATQAARAQGNAFRLSGQQAANSNRLAASEVNLLAQQISDGAIQVTSGQSLFTAILQQGSQVQFLLGSKGVNTIGGSIALLKQGLIGFLNPINLAIAGLAAGAAGASFLYGQIANDNSATEALGRQAKLIGNLADRYDEVRAALDRLQDRPSAAGIALDTEDQEAKRKKLLGSIEAIEQAVRRSLRLEANALTALAEPLTADGAIFRQFQQELRATADQFVDADTQAEALMAQLLELARTAPDMESEGAIRKIIREARNADDGLEDLVRQLRTVEARLSGIGEAAAKLGRIDEAANERIAQSFGIFEEEAALDKLRAQLRPKRTAKSAAEQQAEKVERLITSQDQSLDRLRLEIRLVGESEAVRRRAIAALEAEQQIRELGIASSSREAGLIRQNAKSISEETLQLEQQQAAWDTVRSASETALKTMASRMRSGDISGALNGLLDQLSQLVIQLGVINPLMNSVFGTRYSTLSGVGSVLGGLFGGPSPAVEAATFGLYRFGGATGAGNDNEIAGFVHRNEYVFDAEATRRIGADTLETIRQGALKGYQSGGSVSAHASPALYAPARTNGPMAAPVSISVHNHTNAHVEPEETRDEGGGRNIRFIISEQVADAMSLAGGAAQRTMRTAYGLQPGRPRR